MILVIDAEEVDEALECDLLWKDLIEDTEEEVLFRPPSPRTDDRRYEECGVNGCGDIEFLFGGELRATGPFKLSASLLVL